MIGNAKSLVQSEDWAALIADAKLRRCFVDMECIPKEFLVLKSSTISPAKGLLNNLRSSRSGGPRQRYLDMLPEPKSGGQSEDEEKPNYFPQRNGCYKNLKSHEISIEDTGHSSKKSRDASQYGITKKQNFSSASRREI